MVIFRDDDINPNTDIETTAKIHKLIKRKFQQCKIYSAVSLFSKTACGSVYPDPPFKDKPVSWFYDVDRLFENRFNKLLKLNQSEIVSHGLIHADHSNLGYDAQQMSILTSCHLLKTNKFVPPFNRFNEDTKNICHSNGIEIIAREGWRCLEYEKFDGEGNFYFHSWRWTVKDFEEKLNEFKGIKSSRELAVV